MGALRDRLLAQMARTTAPKLPAYRAGTQEAMSNTGAPLRYITPPQPTRPWGANPQEVDRDMMRWLAQIRQERGNMHVMLDRMAREVPEMTAVYQHMAERGYRVRSDAMTAINQEFFGDQAVAGNPHQPNIYYSNRRLIYKVCELHGIFVADMSPNERIAAIAYGDGKSAVYAYLQTYTDQPHVLVIDRDPYGIGMYRAQNDARSINVWTWYAACCLAKFLHDEPLYSGPGGIVETIAPFDPRRHAAFWPLAHKFAKCLLYMDDHCPDTWHCGCNRIEALLVQRPQAHPWPTGELPSDVVRQEVARQMEEQGYGQAAPPSRGMTPPNGTRLHEWNRQHRGDTDPNMGRGGK